MGDNRLSLSGMSIYVDANLFCRNRQVTCGWPPVPGESESGASSRRPAFPATDGAVVMNPAPTGVLRGADCAAAAGGPQLHPVNGGTH